MLRLAPLGPHLVEVIPEAREPDVLPLGKLYGLSAEREEQTRAVTTLATP